MRYLWFLVFIVIASTSSAQTGQFCFASAETYYEQVYCQLQAKAQAKGLPAFHQFRKNTEAVQFSLLKRPAERNAIKLPAPARKTDSHNQQPAIPLPTKPQQSITSKLVAEKAPTGKSVVTQTSENSFSAIPADGICHFAGKELQCGAQKFYLLGNKANHRLAGSALSPENKMALPNYHDGDLNKYLTEAYLRYIAKMCDIGLGGVTMTYGKFAYLYQDVRNKGLDFSQRFETMYGFLKKDKANMGVSEAVSLPDGISANLCVPLGDRYYVCDHHGRNYIFELR